MSAALPRVYRFATAAHWGVCLVAQGEPRAEGGDTLLRPPAAFDSPTAPSLPSQGAFAPAFAPGREVLWRDTGGRLLRAGAEADGLVEAHPAPTAIARARRLCCSGDALWACAPGVQPPLQCFDPGTPSRRFGVALQGLIDIAPAACAGVMALVVDGAAVQAVSVDGAGNPGRPVPLQGLAGARGLAWLRGRERLAVLDGEGLQLRWFDTAGQALRSTVLAQFAPCFVGDCVAGDAGRRVVVAGQEQPPGGGRRPRVLVFDAERGFIAGFGLPEAATGVAAGTEALLATTERGLYRIGPAAQVPQDLPELRVLLATPVLEAPDMPDGRRWLRAEIDADLPPGTTLEVAWVATDDAQERERLQALLQDAGSPPERRLRQLRERARADAVMVFHGQGAAAADAAGRVPLAVPLHGVPERFVGLLVTLAASAGARLPALRALSLLYPGRSLMEHLPAIYRREEAQPGAFLRTLVGVLETTTQGLDARIAALGGLIHPQTAPGPWLDATARWLGLPWDDALALPQKRCIAAHAAEIARGRGTRAGLETLLRCLLPDEPRRWRLVDFGVDHGFALVGGPGCRGGALPALLGGLPGSAARLGVRATLGRLRLPQGTPDEDPAARLAGQVRVDVAASARERAQWAPWLERVLAEMVPVTARLRLRWLGPQALQPTRLGDDLVLEAPLAPLLGQGAVTGLARLPVRGAALPADTTGDGPTLA